MLYDAGFKKCFVYGYTANTSTYKSMTGGRHKSVLDAVLGDSDAKGRDAWASRFRRRYHNGVEVPEAPNLERAAQRGVRDLTPAAYWKGPKSDVLKQSPAGVPDPREL